VKGCFGTIGIQPTVDLRCATRVTTAVVRYVVFMAAVVVGVDFLFFRSRFWERLMANVGIVRVFAAFYVRFPRQP